LPDEVLGTVITTPPAPDEVDDLQELPFTGPVHWGWMVVAAGLVTLGTILVIASRPEEG
jgi:hypothetical protein